MSGKNSSKMLQLGSTCSV